MLDVEPSTSSGWWPCHSRAWDSSVGKRLAGQRAFERCQQQAEAEHLRRARAPETRPIDRHFDCGRTPPLRRAFEARARSAPLAAAVPAVAPCRHAVGPEGSLQRIRRPVAPGCRPRHASSRVSSLSRSAAGKHGRAASCTSTQSSFPARRFNASKRIANRTHCARAPPWHTVTAGMRSATFGHHVSPEASATAAPAHRPSARNGANAHSITVRPRKRRVLLGNAPTESRARTCGRHDEPIAHGGAGSARGSSRGRRAGRVFAARRNDLIEGLVAGDHAQIAAGPLFQRRDALLEIPHFGGEAGVAADETLRSRVAGLRRPSPAEPAPARLPETSTSGTAKAERRRPVLQQTTSLWLREYQKKAQKPSIAGRLGGKGACRCAVKAPREV